MGLPCPPCKRLRGADLELLPHVNNVLGSFLVGREEVREELMSHLGRGTFIVIWKCSYLL